MISVAELLAQIGDHADEQVLADLEEAAVAFVERQTGRHFGAVDEDTEFVTGDGSARMWLSEVPTGAVTVEERSEAGGTATELTEDTDYELRTRNGSAWLVRFGDVWTDGYEYEVTYDRGYAAGSEPADIRQLVIDLVDLRYSLAGAMAVRSESMGGYSYTRFGEGDPDAIPGARATIEAWRPPVLA